MEKREILNNVDNLTAEELFRYIITNIVTLEELRNTENLESTKQRAIRNLQNKRDQEDDTVWESCRYGNELGLVDYISNYPAGRHLDEAKQRIEELKEQRRQQTASRTGILNRLRNNPNSFTPGMLRNHLSEGTLTKSDLLECDIPESIIDKLDNIVQPRLRLGETPISIPDGYTEVYFWGIPGSGKTCALSAILSTAEKNGYLQIAVGPGYDYMTRLKNIFITNPAFLPPPSPVESTQYLPFVLNNGDDKPRSVSLIELSGEIFQCFFHKIAGNPMPSPQHAETFNSLMNFLSGKNKKIHFFFIDYEKENDKDADDYTQADYLQAAATFFDNNDVFGKSTDAIYIVITKSDLMDCEKEDRKNHIYEYLNNHNFKAFVKSLKTKCKNYSINGGNLTAIPFSLGEVYFQQICNLDSEPSKKIVDILMERISPNRKSILDVFNK